MGRHSTLRVALLFVPLVAIEGYWATYSASVVNGTSFDSFWPPIHVLFTLALLAGVCVPVHRALREKRRWAEWATAALLWCLLCGILAAAGSVWVNHPFESQFSGGGATFLTLILFRPVTLLLRKIRPLNEKELIALYVLLASASLVMGFGATHFLIPFIVAPRYLATPANHWAARVFPLLPPRLFPTSEAAARDFYIGHHPVPWGLWAVPLTFWTVYVMLVCLVMLGLNGLVRRLWVEQERLTFPQVYLPLEMVRQEESSVLNRFFRSRSMWAGFGVSILLEAMGGLNQYFPSFPSFQFRHVTPMLTVTELPWNALNNLEINIYPSIIGLTFLLTTEISGSAWFFYVIRRLLPVAGSWWGWQDTLTQNGSSFPFADEQSTGAFLALGLLAMWGVFRMRRTGALDSGAGVAPREIAALVCGVVGLVAWMRLFGMTPGASLGYLAVFFLFSLAYTRIRAEAGIGGLTGPMPPQDSIVEAIGSSHFSAQDLAGMDAVRWSSWDLRFLPSEMPSQLESYKMGESSGISASWLFWALLIAVLCALVISYVIELPVIYDYGGNQLNHFRYTYIPQESMNLLSRYVSTPQPGDSLGLSAGGAGMLITLLLSLLRARWFGCPLHPIGYAIGFSRRSIEWIWFSILLGWIAKTIALRVGGLRGFRVALPFFLGLMLGDFAAAGVFGVLGSLFPHTAGYSVYP